MYLENFNNKNDNKNKSNNCYMVYSITDNYKDCYRVKNNTGEGKCFSSMKQCKSSLSPHNQNLIDECGHCNLSVNPQIKCKDGLKCQTDSKNPGSKGICIDPHNSHSCQMAKECEKCNPSENPPLNCQSHLTCQTKGKKQGVGGICIDSNNPNHCNQGKLANRCEKCNLSVNPPINCKSGLQCQIKKGDMGQSGLCLGPKDKIDDCKKPSPGPNPSHSHSPSPGPNPSHSHSPSPGPNPSHSPSPGPKQEGLCEKCNSSIDPNISCKKPLYCHSVSKDYGSDGVCINKGDNPNICKKIK